MLTDQDDGSEQLMKDKNYLELYLKKIGSFPLLGPDEVFSLGKDQKQAYEMLLLNMLGYGRSSFSSEVSELGKAALDKTVKEYCPKNKLLSPKSPSKNLEANLHPEAAYSPEEAISEKEIKDSAENGLSTRDAVIVYSGKYVSGKNYDLFINLIGQVGDLKLEEPLVSLSQLGPENPYCALMDLFYNKISRGLFREAVNNFKERIDPLLPNLEKLLKDSDKISKENALVSAYSNIVKLSRRAEKIRERIITSNLRLVVSIAKKYHGQDLSDLINDGNTGLILAVDHYDHTIASFSTHASEWIEATIKKEILKSGRAHKLNHSLSKESSDLKRTIEHLSGRLERRPTDAEILSFLDWSASKMDEVRTYQKAQNPIYMDDSAGEEGDDTIGESFSDHQILSDEELVKSKLKDKVREAINLLSSMDEQQIIRKRFAIDNREYTLDELARIRGITREGIRRKEVRALLRLREPSFGLAEFNPNRS